MIVSNKLLLVVAKYESGLKKKGQCFRLSDSEATKFHIVLAAGRLKLGSRLYIAKSLSSKIHILVF